MSVSAFDFVYDSKLDNSSDDASTIKTVSEDDTSTTSSSLSSVPSSSSATDPTTAADNSATTARPTAANNNHGFSFPTYGPVPLDNSLEWIIYHEEAIDRLSRWMKSIKKAGHADVFLTNRHAVAGLRESIREKRAEYKAKLKRAAQRKNRVTKPARRVAKKAPVESRAKEARNAWAGCVAEGVSKKAAIRGWAKEVAQEGH
ncbi:hypothetical protein MBLNU457_g2947t1 [Dothideomycetes sp. NU457]